MRQGKKMKKQFLLNFQANRIGQKVKEILKKQNKGGKTGPLKSRKKHFLVVPKTKTQR